MSGSDLKHNPTQQDCGVRSGVLCGDLLSAGCPSPDIREIFSDIWAAVKFDAYPMKFGLRAALGVTDELNLMFS